mgnify:CR=1 FL=1
MPISLRAALMAAALATAHPALAEPITLGSALERAAGVLVERNDLRHLAADPFPRVGVTSPVPATDGRTPWAHIAPAYRPHRSRSRVPPARVGDGLELHRRLTFVGRHDAQAAERRDRVEETAGARRRRRRDRAGRRDRRAAPALRPRLRCPGPPPARPCTQSGSVRL